MSGRQNFGLTPRELRLRRTRSSTNSIHLNPVASWRDGKITPGGMTTKSSRPGALKNKNGGRGGFAMQSNKSSKAMSASKVNFRSDGLLNINKKSVSRNSPEPPYTMNMQELGGIFNDQDLAHGEELVIGSMLKRASTINPFNLKDRQRKQQSGKKLSIDK